MLAAALALAIATTASAGTIGMVADDGSDSVIVFDGVTDTVLSALQIGPGSVGDCAITSDQAIGFATDFDHHVWVIDLRAMPPTLALGTNPITISNPGEDLSLSPDGRFLVVCDGLVDAPISVVETATRREVSTFDLGAMCNSVDVCEDGSVLVAASSSGNVHRLQLDDVGRLTDTGEVFFTGGFGTRGPNNVHCAPGAASGIVLRRGVPEVRSFTIPGLLPVDVRALSSSGSGVSGEFTRDGARAFTRSSGGAIDVFDYSAATGTLGDVPSLTIPVAPAIAFLGIDQMSLGPGGDKLYVPEAGELAIYDPRQGDRIGAITDPSLVSPTGVCFPRIVCGNGVVEPGESCDDGNRNDGDGCSASCTTENRPPDCTDAYASPAILAVPNGRFETVAVGGVSDPDGDPVTISVTAAGQDEPVMASRAGGSCPDAAPGASSETVELRAERSGTGDGRVYHVFFTATDPQGGQCSGSVTVCVPRNRRGGATSCVDQGPLFDSTGC